MGRRALCTAIFPAEQLPLRPPFLVGSVRNTSRQYFSLKRRGSALRRSGALLAPGKIAHTFSRDAPRFGLMPLGLGADGHTASIFPGDRELFSSRKLFKPVCSQAGGPPRITTTGRTINSSQNVFFWLRGRQKRI
ncbi:MAG: hypothetical protein COX65_07445 [Elusimicrobia bacterium CG_4_10_14_0_2_um_filter_56_8]|nr:MAG: hypothetical protein COX65_07445 [Elusimicrobia bacterium CG_4_10_14_0_2_um_filter_56_8]